MRRGNERKGRRCDGLTYVVADASGPQPDHAIQGDEDGKEVGEDNHRFGADAEAALKVPEAEGGEAYPG